MENGQKWPPSKGYSLFKIVTLGQKLIFYAKKGISQKLEHFENIQKWPRSKGYSLCKIIILGQKLGIENMLKTFHIVVVLSTKRLEKRLIIEK